MLILTRLPGESIKVGDNIEVVVMKVEGRVVHLGFNAPNEVRILRREIWDRRQAIQAQADAERKPIVSTWHDVEGGWWFLDPHKDEWVGPFDTEGKALEEAESSDWLDREP